MDTQVVCDFEGAAAEILVRHLLLTMQAVFARSRWAGDIFAVINGWV